jgi:hypothetical protein
LGVPHQTRLNSETRSDLYLFGVSLFFDRGTIAGGLILAIQIENLISLTIVLCKQDKFGHLASFVFSENNKIWFNLQKSHNSDCWKVLLTFSTAFDALCRPLRHQLFGQVHITNIIWMNFHLERMLLLQCYHTQGKPFNIIRTFFF